MREETKNSPEIIKEIQDRIRVILLVAIFFYTIMSGLDGGKFNLSYVGLVSLYFIVYFFFEIFKNKLSPFCLKTVNILTLVGIGIFLLLIILITLVDKIPNSRFLIALFKLPLWGVIIMPLLLTAIISWASSFKKR